VPAAQAGVVIDNSIALQSLTITPASGTASLALTTYTFGYIANSNNVAIVGPCPLALTGGDFACSTSANPLSASINGHFDTNFVGSIGGFMLAGAFGSINISGTSSPVLVNFDAIVPYSQFLTSDIDIASSHLSLSLSVNGQSLFQFVSGYDITRGQFVSDSAVLEFQSSLMLSPGQNNLNLSLGDSVRANPEPSTLWLLLGAIPMVPLNRLRQKRRSSGAGERGPR
jgi:hypothetical protein